MTIEITTEIATKVLQVVDAGLVRGLGEPIPGQMCVEAAVCYAMGLPHSDEPDCVSPALRALKIKLNDSSWSSNDARSKGMRRLALAQLGSAGSLDEKEFTTRVIEMTISKILPRALRSAAKVVSKQHIAPLENAAIECETKPTHGSALKAMSAAAAAAAAATANAAAANAAAAAYAAAAAAAYAASAAAAYAANARDETLEFFAEEVVKILIEMRAPGCQWLTLAPLA
jgi:hypothetical protein